jgi:hypothetical protein
MISGMYEMMLANFKKVSEGRFVVQPERALKVEEKNGNRC